MTDLRALLESAKRIAVPVLAFALVAAVSLLAVERELSGKRRAEIEAGDRAAQRLVERSRASTREARALRDSVAAGDTVERRLRGRIAALLDRAEEAADSAAEDFRLAGDSLSAVRSRERGDWVRLARHEDAAVRRVAARGLARHDSAGRSIEARTEAQRRFRTQMEGRISLLVQDTLSMARQIARRDSALEVAHRSIDDLETARDSLERQRDRWRREADPGLLSAVWGSLPEGIAKLVVAGWACQEGGRECAAALAMAGADAAF